MAYRAIELTCPSCEQPTLVVSDEQLGEYRCSKCLGWWMPVDACLNWYRRAVPDTPITELMVHNDGTPRRPCAVCGQKMDIAWIDLLQLDQCLAHGVWVDCGELNRMYINDIGQDVIKVAIDKDKKRTKSNKKNKKQR